MLIMRMGGNLKAFHRDSGFHYQLFPKNPLELPPVCKVFYLGEHKALLLLESSINAYWGDQFNASFSQPNCLEVMAGGVSKGSALEKVVKYQNRSLKDCIAFGDGINDLEMLSIVGKGCIMGSVVSH